MNTTPTIRLCPVCGAPITSPAWAKATFCSRACGHTHRGVANRRTAAMPGVGPRPDGDAMTLQEIADAHGVSKMRIDQIATQAIRALRWPPQMRRG